MFGLRLILFWPSVRLSICNTEYPPQYMLFIAQDSVWTKANKEKLTSDLSIFHQVIPQPSRKVYVWNLHFYKTGHRQILQQDFHYFLTGFLQFSCWFFTVLLSDFQFFIIFLPHFHNFLKGASLFSYRSFTVFSPDFRHFLTGFSQFSNRIVTIFLPHS